VCQVYVSQWMEESNTFDQKSGSYYPVQNLQNETEVFHENREGLK